MYYIFHSASSPQEKIYYSNYMSINIVMVSSIGTWSPMDKIHPSDKIAIARRPRTGKSALHRQSSDLPSECTARLGFNPRRVYERTCP